MKLSDFVVGQKVKILQRPGIYVSSDDKIHGPPVGEEGVVTKVYRDVIGVRLSSGRHWGFWDCRRPGGERHHKFHECLCMLASPYNWRKL